MSYDFSGSVLDQLLRGEGDPHRNVRVTNFYKEVWHLRATPDTPATLYLHKRQ